jgi:hypothetical protein
MFAAKDRPPEDAAVSSRPGALAAPARINSNLRQESQMPPFVFSKLRSLLPAQKFQRPYFHPLPHSLQQEQNLTPAFPIISALFVRSCAQERKLTHLFSDACALFGKTTGEGVGANAPTPRPKVPGPCRPRREALRSGWSSFRGKNVGVICSSLLQQAAALKTAGLHLNHEEANHGQLAPRGRYREWLLGSLSDQSAERAVVVIRLPWVRSLRLTEAGCG